MRRFVIPSAAAAFILAGLSASSAAPLAPQLPAMGGSALQLARYHDCPPGYKGTSHGSCKVSDYARTHPQQFHHYYAPRTRYHYYHYGYRSPSRYYHGY